MEEEHSDIQVEDAVVRPAHEERQDHDQRTRKQPRYHVILWNDEEHSFEYVILMLKQLFGYSVERGFALAKEVDSSGKAICLTTTMEHAELKRDQIKAFGRDKLVAHCQGSMSATIEPAPE